MSEINRGGEIPLPTLLADLRELHQRLIAANERLVELRERRGGGDSLRR